MRLKTQLQVSFGVGERCFWFNQEAVLQEGKVTGYLVQRPAPKKHLAVRYTVKDTESREHTADSAVLFKDAGAARAQLTANVHRAMKELLAGLEAENDRLGQATGVGSSQIRRGAGRRLQEGAEELRQLAAVISSLYRKEGTR